MFSHLDWDLSNLILAPNGDAVVGVVDWERAAWFPEAGKAMHKMVYQWDGWEGLFDDSEEWLMPREGQGQMRGWSCSRSDGL